MDKLARMEKLEDLLKAVGGHIAGRKSKIHKLAYLCQEAGFDLGQSFGFYYYSIFSYSLSYDLEQAERWEVINRNTTELNDYIELGKEASNDNRRGPIKKPLRIVKDLSKEEQEVLEVLSTVVYLKRNGGYRGQNLTRKVSQLKPHLKEHFPRSFVLARKHYNILIRNAS